MPISFSRWRANVRRGLHTAVAGAAALLAAACSKNTDSNCNDVGVHVYKHIARIEGYVDTSGNGCNRACETNLRHQNVDYIEIDFSAAKYATFPRRAGVDGWPPPRDGKFRIRLRRDGSCAQYLGDGDIIRHLMHCLEYTPIEAFSARYEMKATFKVSKVEKGTQLFTNWRFVERSTNELIASAKRYEFVWDSKHQYLPDLPSDYRCPEIPADTIDLRRIYATQPPH